MATLPILPDTFTAGKRFPHPEGIQMEFKKNNTKKLAPTLCGFLNTVGGYFIIGIHDNGTITGIPRSSLDIYLRELDGILIHGQIANVVTRKGVTTAHITSNVKKLEGTAADLYLLIITAYPTDESEVWQANDSIFRRLNASTCAMPSWHKNPEGEIASLRLYNEKMKDKVHECLVDLKKVQSAAAITAFKHTVVIDSLRKDVTSLSADLDQLKTLIHNRILAEKTAKEAELSKPRPGWLSCLLCGIF